MAHIGVVGAAVSRRRSGTTPTRWRWSSTTYSSKPRPSGADLRICSMASATVADSPTATALGDMSRPAVSSGYSSSS